VQPDYLWCSLITLVQPDYLWRSLIIELLVCQSRTPVGALFTALPNILLCLYTGSTKKPSNLCGLHQNSPQQQQAASSKQHPPPLPKLPSTHLVFKVG
jgi:hypothetical protein